MFHTARGPDIQHRFTMHDVALSESVS